MCFIYVIIKRYQVFCENFVNEKMGYVTNRLQKGERCQRLLLTWRLGPAHMAEGGHHLRNAPNPHPRSGWGLNPKFFRMRVYLMEQSLRISSIFPILVPYCDPMIWAAVWLFRLSMRHSCPILNWWNGSNWGFPGIMQGMASNLAHYPTLITIP